MENRLAYVPYCNTYALPLFDRGGPGWVDRIFALDRLVMNTVSSRIFSFAAVSIWKKPQ